MLSSRRTRKLTASTESSSDGGVYSRLAAACGLSLLKKAECRFEKTFLLSDLNCSMQISEELPYEAAGCLSRLTNA